ncbi:hypothetical protein CLOACE_04060 [Clostridium acetireducens DSM 10703]|jgi:uncharacterized protein YsxB (DUF464 family)|uniref:Ribosomal processing cysteine protease Prp n=1 Tax=Clostridium acetireducens DSM 10703 TaxID=1121290 RepID=A0A1E8F1A1_9CLOT|nr:ribosomal-processing cysteine protease Prp [Clostridium acetireducens]OFI07215.1 hypothetical protein CLOACE_04060 [Clostridium acetireducens DSM 10703]
MINVIFKKKSNKILSYKLEGHANFVDEGYDMVCSAVSGISLTIANGITEVLKIPCQLNVKDGFLNIDLSSCSSKDIDKAQVLMETILLGLKSVEANYGKYIKVKIEEV